jgi:hypothetical protein
VPARLIRYRFDEATIKSLLKTQWWNRDIEWLRSNADSMNNIPTFLGRTSLGTSRM